MYVLVHHTVLDPASFWSTVAAGISQAPAGMTLHHTLTAKDGARATCLWEAESIEAVRSFLEPAVGSSSRNEYSEAENRDGVALPSGIPTIVPPPTV